MTITTKIDIDNGAVCIAVRRSDVDAATIAVAGIPLSSDALAAERVRLAIAMTPLIDRRACTSYSGGDPFTTTVTIDGKPRPDLSTTARWIVAGDSYSVAY